MIKVNLSNTNETKSDISPSENISMSFILDTFQSDYKSEHNQIK